MKIIYGQSRLIEGDYPKTERPLKGDGTITKPITLVPPTNPVADSTYFLSYKNGVFSWVAP